MVSQSYPKGGSKDAGAPHVISGKLVDYGYMWWPVRASSAIDTAFEARGIFGQLLYINPVQKLVIVVLSARSKPVSAAVVDDGAFFTAIAEALK